jgi:hypothetical protein
MYRHRPAGTTDRFVPLPVGQKGADAFEVLLDGGVDLVDVDALGQLEMIAEEIAELTRGSSGGRPQAQNGREQRPEEADSAHQAHRHTHPSPDTIAGPTGPAGVGLPGHQADQTP